MVLLTFVATDDEAANALVRQQCFVHCQIGEIGFDSEAMPQAVAAVSFVVEADAAPPRPRVRVSAEEADAHAARLAGLARKAGQAVWLALETDPEAGVAQPG